MKMKLYYVVKIDDLHNPKPKFIAGPFSFEQADEHPLYQTRDDHAILEQVIEVLKYVPHP